jgi:ADP-ribosylation factor GTPase-activating protein 1
MDSWTDAQLAIMKTGGNDKVHEFLMAKGGIGPRTPIKAKYESPAAQLYKLVLKARVEGAPEPTELPPPKQRPPPQHPVSAPPSFGASGGTGGGDPNGMERLAGETDEQYVARQTRLREEARARMAAKFGSGGLGGITSGGGGGGRGMAGIGSDPNYNPSTGYGGGGSGVGIDSLVSGLGSAFGAMSTSVSTLMQEEQVQSLKAAGGSFWGQLASSVSSVATSIAQPDGGSGGLADLQREIAQQKPSTSVYKGFGSDTYNGNSSSLGGMNRVSSSPLGAAASMMPSFGNGGGSPSLQEAPGLPGEDRNGVERLTGESEEQYVMRQTRLRDEARARMAAKFGNNVSGGLGGVGSGPGYGAPPPVSSSSAHPGGIRSAPSSGNAPPAALVPNLRGPAPAWATSASGAKTPPRNSTPPKKQPINSTDFFSSFGA